MRVIVFVKATKSSEDGVMPTTELMEAMGKFNEELVNAGIMQSGDGLHPSSKGKKSFLTATAAPSSMAPSRTPTSWSPVSGSGM